MSKKQKFIQYIEKLFIDEEKIDADVWDYWCALSETKEKEESVLTENGRKILKFMQETMPRGKARDIADGMMVSSRTVAGSMRKLVSNGFVEKIGSEPIIYCITEEGKNFNIEGENV